MVEILIRLYSIEVPQVRSALAALEPCLARPSRLYGLGQLESRQARQPFVVCSSPTIRGEPHKGLACDISRMRSFTLATGRGVQTHCSMSCCVVGPQCRPALLLVAATRKGHERGGDVSSCQMLMLTCNKLTTPWAG